MPRITSTWDGNPVNIYPECIFFRHALNDQRDDGFCTLAGSHWCYCSTNHMDDTASGGTGVDCVRKALFP